MNIIFVNIDPNVAYLCMAIIALSAIIQVILLLIQHHQTMMLDKNTKTLLDNIDQLSRY